MEILNRLMLIAILGIAMWLGFDARSGVKMKSKTTIFLVAILIILLASYVIVFKIPLKF